MQRAPAANYFYNARVERKAAARSTNAKLPAPSCASLYDAAVLLCCNSAALQNL
jgi:hypothetical protein